MAATTPNDTLPIASAGVPMFLPSRPVRTRERTYPGFKVLSDGRLRVTAEHMDYWRSKLPTVTIHGKAFPVSVDGIIHPGYTFRKLSEMQSPRTAAVQDAIAFLKSADRCRPGRVDSYRAKHSCEQWVQAMFKRVGICNGEIILAASRLGIEIGSDSTKNVDLGISLRWIERMELETERMELARWNATHQTADADDDGLGI